MATMGSARVREAVEQLQHAVQSGRWPINSQIPAEAELALELGVGRSTLREAVRSLTHVGMLEPAPGRGTFVRSLSPVRGVLTQFAADHAWSDILAVRRALEVQAAATVASGCAPVDLDRLRAVHAADVAGSAGTVRGQSPGAFHSLVVELSGNALLIELYAAVMAALRDGVQRGDVASAQEDPARHADHAALIETIAAANPVAAAHVAGTHADRDLVSHPS